MISLKLRRNLCLGSSKFTMKKSCGSRQAKSHNSINRSAVIYADNSSATSFRMGMLLLVNSDREKQPSLCALYWREYNAKKRAEDPNWTAKRRECAARCERKRYMKKRKPSGRLLNRRHPVKRVGPGSTIESPPVIGECSFFGG